MKRRKLLLKSLGVIKIEPLFVVKFYRQMGNKQRRNAYVELGVGVLYRVAHRRILQLFVVNIGYFGLIVAIALPHKEWI